MTVERSPRLLVVDDDLGVIAAYRLVLEKMADRKTVNDMFGLDALENLGHDVFCMIPILVRSNALVRTRRQLHRDP